MTTTPGPRTLAQEVMARHHEYMGGCAACNQTEGPWPCDAYRLAEARADVDGLVGRLTVWKLEADKRDDVRFVEGWNIALDTVIAALLAGDKADTGTLTDCPIEGVHEHAFRGPHYFREWDPANHPSAGDKAEAPSDE